uniref:Uncharacterized protein n=1 Tax=Echeneis naucrates TaxID=173247 RepID=A0A665XD28_ECHNA
LLLLLLDIIKTNGQKHTVNVCVCACLCLSATCEMCGMVGVRDAFYSKNQTLHACCCLSSEFPPSLLKGKPPTKKAKVLQKQPLMTKLAAYTQQHLQEQQVSPANQQRGSEVFDWGRYLGDGDVTGAPVSCFKHVPMGRSWGDISEVVRVEVYWIAGIIKLGFKALLRYEGFDGDSTRDFWLNLVCSCVCFSAILHRISNWKTFLIKRLTGSKTLPPDFTTKVQESMQFPFKKQMRLEVVDKTHLCRTRVALVERWDSCSSGAECDDGTDDFCVTCTVPLIHSIGWSRSIGHRFKRSGESAPEEPSVSVLSDRDPTGAGSPGVTQSVLFQMLEAIDPLNLSAICVATVRKVLADGYLMIGIDGSEQQTVQIGSVITQLLPPSFPPGSVRITALSHLVVSGVFLHSSSFFMCFFRFQRSSVSSMQTRKNAPSSTKDRRRRESNRFNSFIQPLTTWLPRTPVSGWGLSGELWS